MVAVGSLAWHGVGLEKDFFKSANKHKVFIRGSSGGFSVRESKRALSFDRATNTSLSANCSSGTGSLVGLDKSRNSQALHERDSGIHGHWGAHPGPQVSLVLGKFWSAQAPVCHLTQGVPGVPILQSHTQMKAHPSRWYESADLSLSSTIGIVRAFLLHG